MAHEAAGWPTLLVGTLPLPPYVFNFLAAFLVPLLWGTGFFNPGITGWIGGWIVKKLCWGPESSCMWPFFC